jgi:cytochrome oxidase Cu insertion factor (SCO1/SenC/PrrC family)
MMHALIAALALVLVPVHGVVLATTAHRGAIVRTDAVTDMLPPQTRAYRIDPPISLSGNVGIDGYVDRSTAPWTLRDATIAGEFAPGLPDPARVLPVDLDSPLPVATLIDQDGHALDLSRAFAGKTTLLTFAFTRCPDRTLCPAISGKYAYMQSHLDPNRFALVEITLDPPYDSPAVLRAYGATYGAKAGDWKLLTGVGSSITHLLNAFRIDSMRVSSANFVHSDRLFIVTPAGKVAYIVEGGDWDPDGVMAEARAVSGLASNPFERFKLSLVASVVAICGGSQFAGIVLLELALFLFITAIAVTLLWCVGRVLWGKRPAEGPPDALR